MYLNLRYQHLREAKYPLLLLSLIPFIADKSLLLKYLINKTDEVQHTQSNILNKFDVHSSAHRNIFLQNNQQDALVSQIVYSCKTFYMFRTVSLSIIRSSKLHIQQQAYLKQLLLHAASRDKMELGSISSLLAAGSSSCFTYACCCMCRLELLMMDRETVRNMQSVL